VQPKVREKMEKDTQASSTLSDDQLHVWEILSCPYFPPMPEFDGFDPEDLLRMVNAVKAEMAKKYEIR
jgi:hypothetical protein